MIKKHALIIGGNNKLGQHLIKEFKRKSIAARWRTVVVDTKKNFESTESIIVDDKLDLKQRIKEVFKKAKEYAEEYDAIIIANSEGRLCTYFYLYTTFLTKIFSILINYYVFFKQS